MFGSSTFGSGTFGSSESQTGGGAAPPAITGIAISPTTATGATDFDYSITGTGSFSTAGTFSKVSGGGMIDPITGAFTPPAQTGSIQAIVVRITSDQDPSWYAESTITIAASGQSAAYATSIAETFESASGALRTNLTGMRWYVWAEVAPTLLGAPIAQGIAETTDGAGVSLIDITGQTSVAPGAAVTLGFTNSNGDPAQANLISWFGTVVAH